MDSSLPTNRRLALGPQADRCVWMTAGVLSYQLCERGFDCDACPLDAALRMRFSRAAGAGAEPRPEPPGLPEDRLYSRDHTWVRVLPHPTDARRLRARIGLEPGLAAALSEPRTVVLPAVGEHVKRHHHHAWIVMEGGTLPLGSPVNGSVASTHADLAGTPRAVADQPLGEGWLMEVETTESELKAARLLLASEAADEYAASFSRFRALVSQALRGGRPGLGPTLPDGGEPLGSLSAMLGAARYFSLLRRAFG